MQFPSNARPRIEKLAAQHGLELLSVRRLPPKELMLTLLSVLYLQIGFKSAVYLLAPGPPGRWRFLPPQNSRATTQPPQPIFFSAASRSCFGRP